MRNKKTHHFNWLIAVAWGFSISAWVFLWRRLLFVGDATLVHDNLFWDYPVFHFFASRLVAGELPLWNPFSHGGEPIYSIVGQMRLLEPLAIATVWLGKYLTRDPLLLFHWTRFFATLWMLLGMALVLSRYCTRVSTRVMLAPILCFGSMVLDPCLQDGVINQFLWVPWITYLFLKVFEDGDRRTSTWIFLAVSVGINFQTYFFAVPFLWFLALLAFQLFSSAKNFFETLNRNRAGVLLGILAGGLMLAPNVVLWKERTRFVFPLRMAPSDHEQREAFRAPIPIEGGAKDYVSDVVMSYGFLKFTGGYSQKDDFVQAIAPESNINISSNPALSFGAPSDALIYIGMLPWLMALLGLFSPARRGKKLWTLLFFGSFICLLGIQTPMHRLLFEIYPPISLIRNTSVLVLYFVFGALFFFVDGWEYFLEEKKDWKRLRPWFALVVFQMSLVLASHPAKGQWALRFLVCAVLPLLLVWWKPKIKLLAAVVVAMEMLWTFHLAQALYAKQTPIEQDLRIPKKLHTELKLRERAPSADFPVRFDAQVPRYLANLYGRPYAFSERFTTLLDPGFQQGKDEFDTTRINLRWNSFLLTLGYFISVNSPELSSEFLKNAFAIHQSPISFRDELENFEKRGEELPFTVNEYRANALDISVHAKRSGFLYWSDGFDSNWTARIDGKPVQVLYAGGNFKALKLDAGNHSVRFVYRPGAFLVALAAFYFALFIAVFFWCVDWVSSWKLHIARLWPQPVGG